MHKKTEFIEGLVQIISQALNWRDLCKGGLGADGNLSTQTTTLFSIEYTIPHTQLKDVELRSEDDWTTFLEEAGKKATAQGKLVIKEKQVSIIDQRYKCNRFSFDICHRRVRMRLQQINQMTQGAQTKMMRDQRRRRRKRYVVPPVMELPLLTVCKAYSNR
jgi:hypothetical protein